MTERQELRYNKFCYKIGMYTLDVPYDQQCTGYKKLKELVESGIPAANHEEYIRWTKYPTEEELENAPELKYLTFLHPSLANFLRAEWDKFIELVNS